MPDPSLTQLAADLSRLHTLLSVTDGDLNAIDDPRFQAAIQRRLKKDPAQVRRVRRIATEVSIVMNG